MRSLRKYVIEQTPTTVSQPSLPKLCHEYTDDRSILIRSCAVGFGKLDIAAMFLVHRGCWGFDESQSSLAYRKNGFSYYARMTQFRGIFAVSGRGDGLYISRLLTPQN